MSASKNTKNTHDKTDLWKALLPGDIVCHRTEGSFIGTLITEYTHSPYSHCETYIRDGKCVSANIPTIVEQDKMFTLWVDVFRWEMDLTPSQAQIITEESLSHLGERYEVSLLLMFPWVYLFPKLAKRKAANRAYICSELVDIAYSKALLDIRDDISLPLVSPADISTSSKLRFIGSFYHGTSRTTTPNIRDPAQKPPNRVAQWIIKKIIKPEPNLDEFISYQQKFLKE